MNGNESIPGVIPETGQYIPTPEPVQEAQLPPQDRSSRLKNMVFRWSDDQKAIVERAVAGGWTGSKIDWNKAREVDPSSWDAMVQAKSIRAVQQQGYKAAIKLFGRTNKGEKLSQSMKETKATGMTAAQRMKLERLGAKVSKVKPKTSHHKKYYVPAAKRRAMEARQLAANGPTRRPDVALATPTPPAAVQGLLPNFCCKCGWDIRSYVEQAAKIKAMNEGR